MQPALCNMLCNMHSVIIYWKCLLLKNKQLGHTVQPVRLLACTSKSLTQADISYYIYYVAFPIHSSLYYFIYFPSIYTFVSTAALAERQSQKTESYSLQSIPALTLTMSQRIGRSFTPLHPHHSLHDSSSLKRTVDNNDTRTDPTNITVLSQNPDIDARGEVSIYAYSQ